MIEEQAEVVEVADGRIWIESTRHSACDGCRSKSGCGTLNAVAQGSKRVRLEVLNPLNFSVKKNDQVWVGIEENTLVRASILIYLLPLLVFFFSALVAHWSELPEGGIIIIAMLSLVASFVLIKRFFLAGSVVSSYQPVLLKVAERSSL